MGLLDVITGKAQMTPQMQMGLLAASQSIRNNMNNPQTTYGQDIVGAIAPYMQTKQLAAQQIEQQKQEHQRKQMRQQLAQQAKTPYERYILQHGTDDMVAKLAEQKMKGVERKPHTNIQFGPQGNAFGYNPQTGQIEKLGGAQVPQAGGDSRYSNVQVGNDGRMYGLNKITGQVEALPGAAIPQKPPEVKASDVAGLRKEYASQSKDFIKVRDAYGKIEAVANNPSPQNDMALIFNYMKMLDPGSTVREGEFANAENAAGASNKVRQMYNKVISGEKLTPEQRAGFIQSAGSVFGSQYQLQKQLEEQFTGMARRMGYDPANVAYDIFGPYRGFEVPGAGGENAGGSDTGAPSQQAIQEELKRRGLL